MYTSLDHEVVDLHAYDPEGTVINYSLNASQIPFDIDPDTGRVYVTSDIDREVSYICSIPKPLYVHFRLQPCTHLLPQ